jgi:serine/threonine protein kinase
LVMEYLSGESLRAALQRAGVFTPAVAAEWFDQILEVIGVAHDRGIVHRDLKPENIIGCRDSAGALSVKIVDFGLAKLTSTEGAAATMRHADSIVGTWGYMAPEQILGQELDHRCDLFAAGVILVEMLTGTRPFSGASFQQVSHAVLNEEFHLPASTLEMRALDAVLQHCLAKERNARSDSATALRRELMPALRWCCTGVTGVSTRQASIH